MRSAFFRQTLLEGLGKETAESLVGWLRDLSSRAKDGDRDRIVTMKFKLPDESVVYGFIPVPASAEFEAEVIQAWEAAGRVAEIAGPQAASPQFLEGAHQTAFLWKNGEWHLAWSVGSDDLVRVTNWPHKRIRPIALPRASAVP